MKKYVLAIGNSFSRDATAYLYDVCTNLGLDVHVVNMYIGGCSLERHWQNVEKDDHGYQYQENGIESDRYVSIKEMLHLKPWDYIITQQSSHDSGWYDTYEPFAGLLIDYIKKEVPGAQIMFQQTWAYEIDSNHGNFMRYNRDQAYMYEKSSKAYKDITDKYSLPLIPCGEVIQNLRKEPEFDYANGGLSLCRDGFHMHFVYGRYALSLTWAKKLFDIDPMKCTYIPHPTDLDAPADEKLLEIVKKNVALV